MEVWKRFPLPPPLCFTDTFSTHHSWVQKTLDFGSLLSNHYLGCSSSSYISRLFLQSIKSIYSLGYLNTCMKLENPHFRSLISTLIQLGHTSNSRELVTGSKFSCSKICYFKAKQTRVKNITHIYIELHKNTSGNTLFLTCNLCYFSPLLSALADCHIHKCWSRSLAPSPHHGK